MHFRDLGYSVRSVGTFLAALAFYSKAAAWSDFLQDFRIRKMLERFRRVAPTLPDSHRPISPTILFGLGSAFRELCSSLFETHLFRAVALVMFWGAFCPSKVLFLSRGDASGGALLREDLTLTPNEAILVLRRSKTDQMGRRQRAR